MAIPVTNPGSNRDNCPKISTSCVIWQGPDIPCIDLCGGDSIDEVVFKLATLLCTISDGLLDVSTLDFQCLVDLETEQIPTNLQSTIQLIISHICNNINVSSFARVASFTSTGEAILVLPECLYYTDENNDLITSLPQSDYNTYVANKVCDVILIVNTHTQSIGNLTGRVNTLQALVESIEPLSIPDIYVVSQCASDFLPDRQILIQDAFTNLEKNYCDFKSFIGTSTSLYNSINSQIPNLSSFRQLVYPDLQMGNLVDWVATPTRLSDTITNLWLTIGDIRTKFQSYLDEIVTIPCILALPENVAVTTIASSYATLVFDSSSLGGIERPLSYKVDIYNTSDTLFTTPLFSQIVNETDFQKTINISSVNILPATSYRINVSSIYTCGASVPAFIISELLTATNLYTLDYTNTGVTSTVSCGGDSYDLEVQTVTLSLITIIGSIPKVNDYTEPLQITIRYESTSCGLPEISYTDVTYEIAVGDSDVIFDYISKQPVICLDKSCSDEITTLACGVYISKPGIEFTDKLLPCV